MSGQDSENPASEKMADSYAMALKHNNNTHKDNAEPDAEYFNVKPVFILESDIFGSSKPDKNNYLTHTELFKCIDLTIPANHLNGLQRVIGGVWRIYPDSEEDRETLVVSSITVRKKRIEVYPRNPKYVEKESPTTVRIRIKNIPLSADDGQLIRYLQNWHLEVLNYQRERLRIDGVKQTKMLKLNVPNACKKGHKKSECTNDWKCKTCGTNGHISKDCTAEFDKNSQADSDVSSEESDEASEAESEKGEEIVLSQSTENLLDITHTEEISKNAELPTDTNNTNVPDQNPSELKSDETDQQHPEQCMKKKRKRKKHPNHQQQLMVH
ncbi:CNBP [Mytilus edulis]|uniref:CNBP n=1 Tax=Mytilus edulis TaxID=6550 RepID=A0A8S3VAC9_MYTED|nr:CNBP [Mytilus edulis]